MKQVKQPMSSSYKAVFAFAIFMLCFTFVMAIATKSKSMLGVLVWGYVIWMMYKRNNVGLVVLFNSLLWLSGIGSILLIYVYSQYGDDGSMGYSKFGAFLLLAIIAAIDLALLKFFKRQVNPIQVDVRQKQHSEEAWAKALSEFDSDERNSGVWARCFAEANGDEAKAKASYLKVRVQEISAKQVEVSDTRTSNLKKEKSVIELVLIWVIVSILGFFVIYLILENSTNSQNSTSNSSKYEGSFNPNINCMSTKDAIEFEACKKRNK